MKQTIYLFLSVLFTLNSFSQNIEVSGTVIDKEDKTSIPGVNVVVENTTTGTLTDFDGVFTLQNVSSNANLIFSSLGYVTQVVPVNSTTTFNIVLSQNVDKLDEVVVIGYGTQTKKEVTGAVAIISSEAIEKLKPTRIEQALQGQVAGVNITTTSGSPGASSSIRIRGVSTNGDNQPLILVDGNRIEDLSVINPSDIESINVLKDATAGIYGVQAANGVIIITTKSGRKNADFKFVFNSYVGTQETTRRIPVLNATEYGLLANEAYAANGDALPFTDISSLGQGTDWQDEVFQTAFVGSSDISISKGTEKGAYNFSASYLDQDGIVGLSKSNFNRLTSKLNANIDILENLKLTSSIIYTNTNGSGLNENGLGSVLFNALNFAPNLTPTDAAGDYTLTPANGFGQEIINPLSQIATTFNKTEVNKIAPTIGLNYKFLSNFSADVKFQYNYANVFTKNYSPINSYGESSTVFDKLNNSLTNYKVAYEDYIFDAYINYENTFKDVHNLKVLLGTSVSQNNFYNKINNAGFDFANGSLDSSLSDADRIEDFNELANTPDKVDGSRLLSYFTRVQYNYDSKYLLSAVLRRDGSSKFGPENKFGFFPSASVGWIVSEEDFMQDSKSINFLKLRASYGIVGNDRIQPFRYVSLLDGQGNYIFDDIINFGTATGALSNP
jgi:TonB-linked SusC/RagA family outer membrane protein